MSCGWNVTDRPRAGPVHDLYRIGKPDAGPAAAIYSGPMGAPYHQFCPVAKAMELLDERWTLLVIRELMAGSQRFNELRHGLPQMSPALLSKRLLQLAGAGLLIKKDDGDGVRYRLTPAGRELEPIVVGIASWGVRWIGDIGDEDLDPKLLMWDLHRRVVHSLLPEPRVVLGFEFDDVEPRRRRWWLVITVDAVDVCDRDPGFDLGAQIHTSLRTMIKIWRGDASWAAAIRSQQLTLDGRTPIRRLVPDLFSLPGPLWAAADLGQQQTVSAGEPSPQAE